MANRKTAVKKSGNVSSPRRKNRDGGRLDHVLPSNSPGDERNENIKIVLSELPDIEMIRIDDVAVARLKRLIEKRKGTNELFTIADKIQLNNVIVSSSVISRVFDILKSDALSFVSSDSNPIDELAKLVTAINRAVASTNQSLKILGVTGDKRGEEISGDPLMEALSAIDLETDTPPSLKEEYLASKIDIARTAGDDVSGMIDSEKSQVVTSADLALLKAPVRSFDTEVDGEADTKDVIDVSREGLQTI